MVLLLWELFAFASLWRFFFTDSGLFLTVIDQHFQTKDTKRKKTLSKHHIALLDINHKYLKERTDLLRQTLHPHSGGPSYPWDQYLHIWINKATKPMAGRLQRPPGCYWKCLYGSVGEAFWGMGRPGATSSHLRKSPQHFWKELQVCWKGLPPLSTKFSISRDPGRDPPQIPRPIVI